MMNRRQFISGAAAMSLGLTALPVPCSVTLSEKSGLSTRGPTSLLFDLAGVSSSGNDRS